MLRLCCSHMSQLKMLRQQMPLRNFKLPNSPSILQHSGCPLHMRPHVHARAGFSILRQVGPQLHHVARPGSSSLPLRPVCHSVEPTSDSDYLPLAPAIYEGSPTYDDILTPPLQENMKMRPEDREFWDSHLSRLLRRPAKDGAARLNLDWNTGLSPYFGNGTRQPNGWDAMAKGKSLRPTAIILVKVGKFYETCGIDAVMLVEHTGTKFMGDALSAGCPLVNIHKVLHQLVREAGFEVSVWEETRDYLNGRKHREETQLVTPQNPQYLYGFSKSNANLDVVGPAISGLSVGVRGVDVYIYRYATDSIVVHEGLSVDAAWGLINADGAVKPVVCQHWPLHTQKQTGQAHSSALQRERVQLEKQLKKQQKQQEVWYKAFRSEDPVEGFKQQVLKMRRLPAGTELEVERADVSASSVRPLYLSTASQLGLTAGGGGVPRLTAYMLPEDVPKVVYDTLTSLLIAPPPYSVAGSTRRAVHLLTDLDEPLPDFFGRGITTPKKVLVVLGEQEANARFFQDLRVGLEPVITALSPERSASLAAVVDAVWPLLLHTTGIPPGSLTQEEVLRAAEHAVARVKQLVASPAQEPADNAQGGESDQEAGGAHDKQPSDSRKGSSSSSKATSTPKSKPSPPVPLARTAQDYKNWVNWAIDTLAGIVEVWEERVIPKAIEAELRHEVFPKGDHLAFVLFALLRTACNTAASKIELTTRNCPRLVVDRFQGAVWLKLPDEAVRQALIDVPLHLKHGDVLKGYGVDAPDQLLCSPSMKKRRGRAQAGDTFTCDVLSKAIAGYQGAASMANEAATAVLKALAEELSQDKVALAAALQLGILLSTLLEHSRTAKAAGWSLPLVGSKEQQEARQTTAAAATTTSSTPGGSSSSSVGHPEHDGVLKLSGLWPYWLSGNSPDTVNNDVELQGFMLLTGPNTAGKSTVLRSIAAAALAGSAGLAIPAAPGSQLPLLDAVVLRTFSGDAPQEGLSAYGVEMREMGTVLHDIRPSSLVLVDELGKGTEVISGTALAEGIFRGMAGSGAMGVFATHLHLLVDLVKDVPRLSLYKMEVLPEPSTSTDGAAPPSALQTGCAGGEYAYMPRLRPTWRLLPGTCFDSMAFAVAKKYGLPASVLATALDEYQWALTTSQGVPANNAMEQVVREGKANTATITAASSAAESSSGGSSVAISSDSDNDLLDGSSSETERDASEAESDVTAGPLEAAAGGVDAAAHQGSDVQQHDSKLVGGGRQEELLRRLQAEDSSSTAAGARPSAESLAVSRQKARELFAQFLSALTGAPAAEAAHTTAAAAESAAKAAESEVSAAPRSRRQLNAAKAAAAAEQQQEGVGGVQEQAAYGSPLSQKSIEYGRVHELSPGQQPPPAHEGESIVYALHGEQGWWYLGESQAIKSRVKTHRHSFGKQMVMWYAVAAPGVDRKVLQGHMIMAADRMGLPLWSNRDAAMARKK